MRIDPAVVALIEEGGRWLEQPQPGEAFRISDIQVQDVGYEEAGVVTVESIERGASNGVQLVTSDVRVIETFLALEAAHAWRMPRGLAALTNDRLTSPAGYVVVDEGRGGASVRHPNGTIVARGLWPGDAKKLAVALSYSLDVVVAAIKHPTGDPIWAPGSSRR